MCKYKYNVNIINKNRKVINVEVSNYYKERTVFYLNGTSRETIDLENNEGLWVEKSKT